MITLQNKKIGYCMLESTFVGQFQQKTKKKQLIQQNLNEVSNIHKERKYKIIKDELGKFPDSDDNET